MNRFGVFGDFLVNLLIFFIQVLVLKNLVLFESAFCFAYVIIYLQFSMDTNPLFQLVAAFLIGLGVDIFYNTMGMHAAASVFIVFVKLYWIQLLTPRGGYDVGGWVNVRTQGLQWFLTFAYPLIFLHCLALFFIEAAGFANFWSTTIKAFNSSWLTLVLVLMSQYAFYKKVK